MRRNHFAHRGGVGDVRCTNVTRVVLCNASTAKGLEAYVSLSTTTTWCVQTSYVQQVSRFARHFQQSPESLGPDEIRAYQVYLTNDRKLAIGSILIAVAALRFLYTVTVKKDWSVEDIIPAPKKPQRLPVVLSPEEVLQFLEVGPVPSIARF